MGFHKLIKIFFLVILSVTSLSYAEYPQEIKNSIVFQISNKQGLQALKMYYEHYLKNNKHDLLLLNTIAENILIQGSLSSDEYIQKSCILGAHWSGSTNATKILMNGALSQNPIIQLLTINSLDQCRSQSVRQILNKVLVSQFPIIQLEAAYKLAILQDTQVIDHLQAMFHQMPLFVQNQLNKIFIHIDHEDAHAYIRQYFSNNDVTIRSETAILTGLFQKDIFLPQLRNLVSRPHYMEQEAALFALGELHDQKSYSLIKKFLTSKYPNVRVAAAIALAKIGKEEETLDVIIDEIEQHNLCAFVALTSFSSASTQDILLPRMTSFSADEKLNAAYTLLSHGIINEELLKPLADLLVSNEYETVTSYTSSPAKTILYVKRNPQHHVNKDPQLGIVITQHIKKDILELIFRVPDNHFFSLSKALLKSNNNYLIPILSDLLVSKNTAQVQDLLNTATQSLGSPLTRIYASLALYKMTGNNKYKETLLEWLRESAQETLIILEQNDLKNFTFLNKNTHNSYSLNLEEKTQLFIKILETLLQNKAVEDISTLIDLMLYGHPKNLYLLSGLLIKSLE